MKKNFVKKIISSAVALSLVAGMAGMVPAAVKTGTDISASTKWTSYSIHTREDGGEWEDKLIEDGQKYHNKENAYKSYGEDAKITTQTPTGFLMNVESSGWSATWRPDGKVAMSNPWGITAKKIINVERGRYYTISFKVKSTLENEITETIERKDGTAYNKGTGKYNYIKHIHIKAYDDKDDGGSALTLTNAKATIGGKSVISNTNDFKQLIALDSRNTADDGWVTFSATVKVPSLKSEYQGKSSKPTMGIMFAFGAFLKEFPKENDMKGTIEVKDFKVVAGVQSPAQVTKLKVTPKKKSAKVTFAKVKNVKVSGYEIKYAQKASFKGAKTKTIRKTSITLKKLVAGKKYYVKVRAFSKNGSKKIYGPYSKKIRVTIKK